MASRITKPKNRPSLPGVYLFKNEQGTVLYIGKAKNLNKRIATYFYKKTLDLKTQALLESSSIIDHIVTKNEVEALLLEAKLVQNYQPKFNVLLKAETPYLYLVFSYGENLPGLKLSRGKKSTDIAFGPFLEKEQARRVFRFLTNTFRLKICNKKIPNGCLYYHLGTCAGSCRGDFDKNSYFERLKLAEKALRSGHKKFLNYLAKQIKEHNRALRFEKSQEIHSYHQAFERVFTFIDTNFSEKESSLSYKHIWIFEEQSKELFLFDEINGVTKKRAEFVNLLSDTKHLAYFESYYHSHDCPHTILTNFDLENKRAYEQFLQRWHKKNYPIAIFTNPQDKHFVSLIKLAHIHAEQEATKRKSLGASLKQLLLCQKEPVTIDCFDISHKQGLFMVGSCIRFTEGKPDKNHFRKFKIKTVTNQDDYACLREIVSRRYRNKEELPDLVLIDGGKGQLSAVKGIIPATEVASLAKKNEIIYSTKLPDGIKIDVETYAGRSLIALRDYAHHFALSYHKKLFSAETKRKNSKKPPLP